MKRRWLWLLVGGMALLMAGCKALFPATRTTTESRWTSYDEVAAAFEQIIPQRSGTNELKELGFHPAASPNVKILTYVDVIQIFMPNPGIRKEDLADEVRACIEAKEQSQAFQVVLQDKDSMRYGNLLLDIFGFKRRSHETGWEFDGLVLLTNGVVVYKLSSGQPQISRYDRRIRPLGPLQEVEVSPTSAAGLAR